MGGQLVTQLAAERPDRTIARDAHRRDRRRHLGPDGLPVPGGAAAAAARSAPRCWWTRSRCCPVFRDPRQAAKLVRLVAPTLTGHVVQPWRLLGPMMSILRIAVEPLRARTSWPSTDVPVFALHGACDLAGAASAPRRGTCTRTDGTLVTIERAGHSWILRDPETLPAIMAELLDGELGDGIRARLACRGRAQEAAHDRGHRDGLLRPRRPGASRSRR